eukprot:295487_1
MCEKEKQKKKEYLDLITTSISVCISSGEHAPMSEQLIEATRKYYLSIVNDENISATDKRHKIHKDLVIGTKANLSAEFDNDDIIEIIEEGIDENNSTLNLNKTDNLSIKYRVGLDNDSIKTVNGKIICIGMYSDNEIHIDSNYVSRIHCFLFQINNKLIVLDGWSKYGTYTIDVATNSDDDNQNNNNNEEKNNHQNIDKNGNEQHKKKPVP